MNIYDRSAFDAAYRATVWWGNDVCRTPAYATYSYHTEGRRMTDDIEEIDGKYYWTLAGLRHGPFDTQDDAFSDAVATLAAAGESIYVPEVE